MDHRRARPLYVLVAAALIAGLLSHARATAAMYVVDQNDAAASDAGAGTADHPLKTIGRAAALARAGDVVTVRRGVYREFVELRHSGTANAPIRFVAEPIGSVVVSGAELAQQFQHPSADEPVYATPWDRVFQIDEREGKPVENHPDGEPLWGRAEQVIVDNRLLLPVENLAKLRERIVAGSIHPPESPLPKLGGAFAGYFTVDRASRSICILLAGGSNPADHRVEIATRALVFGVSPYAHPEGVRHVEVRGFIFRDGATFPQRPGVWLPGADNVVEHCVIERMAGQGVSVDGALRHSIIRNNGHCGGSAIGPGFQNRHDVWTGNSWKPISRVWEAGGAKVTDVDGGSFSECLFYRNGGPGLWLDIDVRNVTIDRCAFVENEKSGVFVEISRGISVTHNLATRNAVGAVGRSGEKTDWSCGGIQMAESRDCVVRFNTCVENADGVTLREQGPRTADGATDPAAHAVVFFNHGHTITDNVIARNRGYQLGLWYDTLNYDARSEEIAIDRNVYFADAGSGAHGMLLRAPWQKGSRKFESLAEWTGATRFDRDSVWSDPKSVDPAHRTGWTDAPADVIAWAKGYIAGEYAHFLDVGGAR